MPIYDYRCDHCGHAFSAVQSFKDEPLEKCPRCGQRPRRLVTAPAIVFKGSGWYKTDSRSAAASSGDGSAPAEKVEGAATKEKGKKGDSSAASSADSGTKGAEAPAKEKPAAS